MEKCVYRRDFSKNGFKCFKQTSFETSWDSFKDLKQQNEEHNKLLEIFTELYDKYPIG